MRRSVSRFLPVMVVLAATVALLRARDSGEIVPSYRELSSFPMQIGDWQGKDLRMSPDEQEALGPGQFLLRDYVNSSSKPPVNLFIAFFPSQRSADTLHSPRNCLPG